MACRMRYPELSRTGCAADRQARAHGFGARGSPYRLWYRRRVSTIRPTVTSFADIRKRCNAQGDAIHVILDGGYDSLVDLELSTIRSMPWKFHPADAGSEHVSCVRGLLFLAIVKGKEKSTFAAAAGASIGRNYIDQVTYSEMVAICRRQGAAVIIGVEGGGARKLRRMSSGEITSRLYKYDFAADPIPPKDFSNWSPGDVVLRTLVELGLVDDARAD
jgi:hypothetical protein